ncbi:hypothetical protein GCM10011506_24430 [Marivirga lumbricoides]|uniref:DUF5723 domain-containing protein n=1 Tax=Marivirga lumbricoides TaxID=1046115 RepID=A0ABQ1MBM1_9BACT|nr:hypothetical protein GCM10011506_24430 [Marivirga lumbricoides]
MKRQLAISLLFSLLLLSPILQAQDLENLKDQKPLSISGNVGLGMQTYASSRENPSRQPFIWSVYGNPTLSIYGLTLPFSFVLSRKNEEFRQPFNQFGVSPYYKWIKLHIGFRNMSFSDFTLNGHVFNGVGIELDPGNWRFGAMYGTLLAPISPDFTEDYLVEPTYKRKGYSVKIGYGTSSNYFDLILFKGRDLINSIDRPLDSVIVNPQENLVLGIKTQQRLFNTLVFSADVGLSGWTSNLFAEGMDNTDIPLSGIINNFLDVNYSTQFLTAVKSSLSFRIRQVNLRLQYQRIEPDYQTMGAYFFNNDLENITFSPGWSMFKRKLTVNTSVGWQRNNLFEDKSNQTNRRINSVQVNYSPVAKLNFSGSYTNFQINQRQINAVTRDVIDSLQLVQFSNNLSFNMNYNFGNKVKVYGISVGYTNQSMSQEMSNEGLGNSDSRSISPHFTFRFSNRDSKWGYRGTINYNNFENSTISTFRWGCNLNTNKSFADDKFSLNGTLAYNVTQLDGEQGGKTLRFGIRGDYKPAEKHSIGFGTNLIRQHSANERIRNFNEFLGNLTYSYAF